MPATVDPSWRSPAPGAPRRTVGAVTSPAGRGPLALAALASAAVPGLDPVSVEPVAGGTGARYDVALVQDAEHRRWVIRCPRSAAASAQLEQSSALTALLARRLLLSVPVVKGWVALPEGGRAAVHHYLAGRPVELELPRSIPIQSTPSVDLSPSHFFQVPEIFTRFALFIAS